MSESSPVGFYPVTDLVKKYSRRPFAWGLDDDSSSMLALLPKTNRNAACKTNLRDTGCGVEECTHECVIVWKVDRINPLGTHPDLDGVLLTAVEVTCDSVYGDAVESRQLIDHVVTRVVG
jgi:hypothetical protein